MDFSLKTINQVSSSENDAPVADILKSEIDEEHFSHPLSYGQKALFFLNQRDRTSHAYNLSVPIKISSAVDVAALKQAFQNLSDRHPTLRATFTTQADGSPLQRVHSTHPICFHQIDAASWEQQQLEQSVTDSHRKPFDLGQGPVFRVTLFTRAEQDHILLLTMHQIACDAWSHGSLLNDAEQLYVAAKAGETATLPLLSKQYVDYVQQQAESLTDREEERLWTYWENKLSGDLPTLDLPTDHPRPLYLSDNGGSYPFELSPAQTNSIRQVAHSEGTTPHVLLMAVFQSLLYRYTGQSDILVGSSMGARHQTEFEKNVGYFENFVPVRGAFTETLSFKDFLGQMHATVHEAIEHQAYPFPLLLERLQPGRDSSRSPIVQSVFKFLEYPSASAATALLLSGDTSQSTNWGELELKPLFLNQQEGQFDLTLEMIDTQETLTGTFKYNADLFNADTVERMAGHFQTLIDSIVSQPGQSIKTLPMLTAGERSQLLTTWNDTEIEYPKDKGIHQLIEEQVERTPDDVALVFETQPLTYRELNDRANRLAHYLQSMGVGPEVLVGICLERSIEMVVGLLGILKAGGAYVPLDPAYPQDRLDYMVADSQLSILLTQQTLSPKFTAPTLRKVNIDADWELVASCSNENLDGIDTDNLAYIIYTSGSTGKPKGVQICHRSAVNFLTSMRQQPGLNEQDVLLAVTTISFDISVLELYLPLMMGARVVLAARQDAADSNRLLSLLDQSQATVLQATPTTWQMLLATGWQGNGQLKMLSGGEALSRELANQMLAWGGELWNMYGPTETTVWSAACRIGPGEGTVPVAEPIANTQIYVLPTDLKANGAEIEPLPIGIPGEVHIGGDGLARGYLNRPDLTQSRFINDPFRDQPEARLYKTGDLARLRPDGTLEFLGRIDNQVKIRGFRIELGEIESALEKSLDIQKSVVIVREDNPGDKRLVAYLIPNENATIQPKALRQSLQQILPAYFVPSAFVALDKFPLTPNGKINRRALPQPDQGSLAIDNTYVAPQSELQRQLVDIWKEVLHIDKVGIHDSFFDLGGHSVLVAQVHSRLLDTLDGTTTDDLSLMDLFTHPTIASLVQYLGKDDSGKASVVQVSNDRAKKQIEALKRRKQNRRRVRK